MNESRIHIYIYIYIYIYNDTNIHTRVCVCVCVYQISNMRIYINTHNDQMYYCIVRSYMNIYKN